MSPCTEQILGLPDHQWKGNNNFLLTAKTFADGMYYLTT